MTYKWLQNGTVVAEEKNYKITSAQVGHSGIYQCRTNLSNSASFRLDVVDGELVFNLKNCILTPPFLYSNDLQTGSIPVR